MDDLSETKQLQFLKLGGSLITNKYEPNTARLDVLTRLAEEIAQARHQDPQLTLIIGHGSGSFGHVAGQLYGTRQGVRTEMEWIGFVKVWQAAQALNRLVMDALLAADLPAVAFSPLASITARSGKVSAWELPPLRSALKAGLIPVIYGDVVFDTILGGTILSTEDLFTYLARQLRPHRILLAGIEAGVWDDYPACTRLIQEITPANYPAIQKALGGSTAADVTGGMASKVHLNLELVSEIPELEILIFSGDQPGHVSHVLQGAQAGTCIHT